MVWLSNPSCNRRQTTIAIKIFKWPEQGDYVLNKYDKQVMWWDAPESMIQVAGFYELARALKGLPFWERELERTLGGWV